MRRGVVVYAGETEVDLTNDGHPNLLKIRVALAWLDRDDWPRWLEVDPSLPPYNEWLLKVEARYREAYQRGVQFEVIRLDPTVFTAWCKMKGCAPGEAARAEYATAALAKRPR